MLSSGKFNLILSQNKLKGYDDANNASNKTGISQHTDMFLNNTAFSLKQQTILVRSKDSKLRLLIETIRKKYCLKRMRVKITTYLKLCQILKKNLFFILNMKKPIHNILKMYLSLFQIILFQIIGFWTSDFWKRCLFPFQLRLFQPLSEGNIPLD